MIPCLYKSSETAFDTNGIGKLSDAISCVVTEKRNSSYELKMEYPSDGIHAESIVVGNIIRAKPSETADPQPFRIYKVTTPFDGKLEVAARHISYQLNFITVSPLSVLSGTKNQPSLALAALKDAATTGCPFSFSTDITSEEYFGILEPNSIRNCLGGIEGSILDTFGGEYEWDGYRVILHKARGTDNNVRIVYGKNLTDFKMEKSIENVITGVHPYYKNSETGEVKELPEKVVYLSGATIDYEKVVVMDCSEEFEAEPTESQIRSCAESYLKTSTLTEPDIDIDIDFIALWQTPGYEDIAEAERVSLCDTVHVYIDKLGLDVSCKVTETEYDSLLERYNSITLSNCVTSSRNKSIVASLVTEDQAKSMISVTDSAIRLSVAKTYVTNENLENNYSTTVQVKSYIETSAEAVTLSFQKTLESYSTTTEIKSLIKASEEGIELSVTNTLKDYTKTSEIRSRFAMDPTSITIESGVITFDSNTISINSDNFKLSASGEVTAKGSFNSGSDSSYRMELSSGQITGYYKGEEIGSITASAYRAWTIDGESYVYQGICVESEDIKLQGTLVDINADYLNINYAEHSYYYGSTGTIDVITDLDIDWDDRSAYWHWQTLRFQKGILVTEL